MSFCVGSIVIELTGSSLENWSTLILVVSVTS